VFTRQQAKLKPFLIVADLAMVWAAFGAAYLIRQNLPLERQFFLTSSVRTLLLLAGMAAWVLSGLWIRAYDQIFATPPLRIWTRAFQQSAIAVTALVFIEYTQRLDLSRPFLGLWALLTFGLLSAGRLSIRAGYWHWAGAGAERRIVYIAGIGEAALRLARLVEQNSRYGLELGGFLAAEPGQVELSRCYTVHAFPDLPRLLETRVVDDLLFAVDSRQLAELEDLLLLCEEEGVRTRFHLGFLPHLHSRVDLEFLSGEPLLTFSGAPHDEFRLLVKRAADIVLAGASLAVLWPVMAGIAILIRLTSPGPAIFRQVRCGLNGRRFTLYKFRTMTADAEQRKAELAHLNVKKTAFKIPNDPRVTPLGRWLRKFSLDELPQLWNVLKGEMSIVGPRPPVPEEVERYERWQRRRLRMRPGLTCLWTLAGRDELDFDEWMRLDLEYIDRWSLALDLEIILRTIPKVLFGRGAN
jgi:exopolysaccharide biosynthesis polyprenyl glycosylphosphotransferase